MAGCGLKQIKKENKTIKPKKQFGCTWMFIAAL